MKLSLSSHWLILLLSLYFASVMNLSFWRYFVSTQAITNSSDLVFPLTLPLLFLAGFTILFSLLVIPYITKPIMILLLMISSLINYAMFNLGLYIDVDLIRRFFEINSRGAGELMTWSAVYWILLLGILPSLFLIVTPISYQSIGKELLTRSVLMLVSFGIIAFIVMPSYQQYMDSQRDNPQVQHFLESIHVN